MVQGSEAEACKILNTSISIDSDTKITVDLPLKKNRRGEYRVSSKEGIVETCCTSDFFHPDADAWRREAWGMMKERADLTFFIITKRPERFYVSLPDDWGAAYENVIIGCSCESQYTADRRLPVFLGLPVRHKKIVLQPMLQAINIERYLERYGDEIEEVTCGGEIGEGARELDYAWVISMNIQCVKHGVPFRFVRTGTHFRRGGKLYMIQKEDEEKQALKANINYFPQIGGGDFVRRQMLI